MSPLGKQKPNKDTLTGKAHIHPSPPQRTVFVPAPPPTLAGAQAHSRLRSHSSSSGYSSSPCSYYADHRSATTSAPPSKAEPTAFDTPPKPPSSIHARAPAHWTPTPEQRTSVRSASSAQTSPLPKTKRSALGRPVHATTAPTRAESYRGMQEAQTLARFVREQEQGTLLSARGWRRSPCVDGDDDERWFSSAKASASDPDATRYPNYRPPLKRASLSTQTPGNAIADKELRPPSPFPCFCLFLFLVRVLSPVPALPQSLHERASCLSVQHGMVRWSWVWCVPSA